jgi:phosphohistidine phosphatase SixA
MKKIMLLSIILFGTLTSCVQTKEEQSKTETSTYYFIRHAEKDRSDASNQNPHLIEKGKQRAEHWKNVFKNIKFDAIYSTEYHRTIETAQPTALKNNIEITLYNPKEIDVQEFLNNTKGQSVLVVGHSNSTPKFVNSILSKEKYEHIDDSNNANLYIVTISGDIISDTLLLVE